MSTWSLCYRIMTELFHDGAQCSQFPAFIICDVFMPQTKIVELVVRRPSMIRQMNAEASRTIQFLSSKYNYNL